MTQLRVVIALLTVVCIYCVGYHHNKPEAAEDKLFPYLLDDLKRSWPDGYLDIDAYHQNIHDALRFPRNAERDASWQLEGPTNIGGRINCTAIDPYNSNVVYAGACGGGIWKTTDGGNTWLPTFDDNPHLAIGAITINAQNTQTVYAGTGDLNVPSGLELGDGLYKSTNGGQTWTHIGLAETRVISKIIVHPQNSDILWVSAMGNIFTQDNQRGIYKTIDGGQSWQQVLWVDVNAGVSEMLIHPTQPDILFATSFNRFRNEDFSVVYGDDAHVWRSVDGGETWQILTEDLPQGNFSRMGIAISESNPEVLYVSVADSVVSLAGIYKTTNGGDQWQPVNGDNLLSNFGDPLAGFGWYFGKIYINPANEQVIYLLGVDQYYSLDGGETWNRLTPEWWNYTVHADGHYLDFISDNEFILSTDGGMYRTTNGGLEWQVYGELPISQFYHVTAHPTETEWVYGGAQDNGTTSGNYLGLNQWPRIYGGDGFKTLIHPETPEILYVSTQYGGFNYSEDGGFSFSALNMPEETGEYRFGWDAPWLLNPVNPQQLFFGGTHVYRIDDAPFGLPLEISPLLVDSLSNEEHEAKYVHSITSIDVSENDDNIIYASTGDAHVWRTLDGGASWSSIEAGLPQRWVSCVRASKQVNDRVYVSLQGYRMNDFQSHIFMSENHGTSWIDISQGLPQVGINHIEIVPYLNDEIVFIATDAGVYYKPSQGQWLLLGNNLPPMRTEEVVLSGSRIYAATYARSIWSIDVADIIYSPVSQDGLHAPTILGANTINGELRTNLPTEIEIYDLKGSCIWRSSSVQTTHTLPEVQGGIYIAVMRDCNSQMSVQKIILRE
jgi:photosystem II stability/assembly factor-like uncharacterized protein